jgi:hypothetical protein
VIGETGLESIVAALRVRSVTSCAAPRCATYRRKIFSAAATIDGSHSITVRTQKVHA